MTTNYDKPFELRPGQGSAFKNKDKTEDWHADYKGELLLPAYHAEGIEPTEQALVDGIMHMMATQTKMDAI